MKSDYIRYSPSEISTINTGNSQMNNSIHREDSVISWLNSFLVLLFDVLHAATNNRDVDGNGKRLVNLGPIALISNYKLTTSSRKHLEDTSHAHIVSLMSKLITSARGSDDLPIGFDRSCDGRQQELTENKNQKEKYRLKILLRHVFGYAEDQRKAIFGISYHLTLTRLTDKSVLIKDNATVIGKIKNNCFD